MATPEIDLEKDDRQIRLWGLHGQLAIHSAKLYVLGSDCQATESLKTMLLHGVRDMTLVDDAFARSSQAGHFDTSKLPTHPPRLDGHAAATNARVAFAGSDTPMQNASRNLFANIDDF